METEKIAARVASGFGREAESGGIEEAKDGVSDLKWKIEDLASELEAMSRSLPRSESDLARVGVDSFTGVRLKKLFQALAAADKASMDFGSLLADAMRGKVARAVNADDEFTIEKPLKLKSEGDTRTSLMNAELIKSAGYEYDFGHITYNSERAVFVTEVGFKRGNTVVWHKFLGFSLGYSGEGPRGLVSFLKMFGQSVSPEKVFDRNLPSHGEISLSKLA